MMKKPAVIVAVAIFVVSLIPFFIGCFAAHPATDDFTFAYYTHATWIKTGNVLKVVKDALSYALRTWRDWQGTLFGVLIMALNPAVFDMSCYGVHAVILILFHVAAWYAFLFHFLKKRLHLPHDLVLLMFLCQCGISLIFLPDIVEGIYWFNGAWFYTGAQALSLFAMVCCDKAATDCGKGKIPLMVLSAVLLGALALDNFITAMMTLCLLVVMLAGRIWIACTSGEKAGLAENAFFLVPMIGGLLLAILAPGNQVRMATDGAHESGVMYLLWSFFATLRAAGFYILRFFFKTPVAALLFFLIPVLQTRVHGVTEKTAERIPPIPALIAAWYLILAGMIFPHMYSSGYAGSGRVINMYHDYVVLTAPVLLVLAAVRLRHSPKMQEHREQRYIWFLLGGLCLSLCLAMGQQNNYGKLISDQLNGTQKAYREQFQREYQLCETADREEDVLLPAWTVQTVTGKPTVYPDPTVWTNEAMASYFGVRSVRSEETAE